MSLLTKMTPSFIVRRRLQRQLFHAIEELEYGGIQFQYGDGVEMCPLCKSVESVRLLHKNGCELGRVAQLAREALS